MIQYKVGDATIPASKNTIIVHCCNDVGAWGAGFVIPLALRYPSSKDAYRIWSNRGKCVDSLGREVPFHLGSTQFVLVEDGVLVANMIGQEGVMKKGNIPPIRYNAIRECLRTVKTEAIIHKMSVQMPKIGAGLAGGDWEIISKIIEEELEGIETTIFTLS